MTEVELIYGLMVVVVLLFVLGVVMTVAGFGKPGNPTDE